MSVEKMAYSIQEASEALGLHPNTIYNLVKSGKLPSVNLGRKILISKLELSKWLAGQSNTPPSAGAGRWSGRAASGRRPGSGWSLRPGCR